MASIPESIKFLLFGFGPALEGQTALIANLIGLISMILGIVAAATNRKLGLGATNWFLLTIALFIFGLALWFSAYFGAQAGM